MTSESKDIAVALDDDGVARLTFCRPPSNYFNADLLEGIANALAMLAQGGIARSVVLQSDGQHFCAGADPDPDVLYERAVRIFTSSLPIVAVVQGAAIGGGLGLALAADFRVGSPESRLSANFARLGFHHGFGLTATLPAIVGQQRALDLLLTGRRIAGEEARAIGLLDQLVPPEQSREAGYALAREIARSAPLAVAAIRGTMRQRLVEDFRRAVQHEAKQQRRLYLTSDFAEGVAAVRERRPARFRGC
jgi:2-(1,2-epoxy-1,2-dihydrophenyl)acetyl-CoA isomerase